jgi:hypothetical protein
MPITSCHSAGCAVESTPAAFRHSCLGDIGRNRVERGHQLQNGVILPLTTTGALSPVGPFRFRRQLGAAPTLHNTGHHENRTPTHGYEPTREAAMAAFAKSWRRE